MYVFVCKRKDGGIEEERQRKRETETQREWWRERQRERENDDGDDDDGYLDKIITFCIKMYFSFLN